MGLPGRLGRMKELSGKGKGWESYVERMCQNFGQTAWKEQRNETTNGISAVDKFGRSRKAGSARLHEFGKPPEESFHAKEDRDSRTQ